MKNTVLEVVGIIHLFLFMLGVATIESDNLIVPISCITVSVVYLVPFLFANKHIFFKDIKED